MTAQKQLRCVYRSPSGRRCRENATIGWNRCQKHWDHYYVRAAADEIVSNRDRLDTAEGIHSVMARIIRGQAAGKIRSKDAASMMYSCQTMLSSLPRLAEERKKIFLAEEEDLWREKVLADSLHDKLNCAPDAPGDEGQEEK